MKANRIGPRIYIQHTHIRRKREDYLFLPIYWGLSMSFGMEYEFTGKTEALPSQSSTKHNFPHIFA
jgi:hypothetical protein